MLKVLFLEADAGAQTLGCIFLKKIKGLELSIANDSSEAVTALSEAKRGASPFDLVISAANFKGTDNVIRVMDFMKQNRITTPLIVRTDMPYGNVVDTLANHGLDLPLNRCFDKAEFNVGQAAQAFLAGSRDEGHDLNKFLRSRPFFSTRPMGANSTPLP